MTPKEKAEDLYNNFYNHCFNPDGYRGDNEDNAIECALICVDEVLNQYYTHTDNVNQHTFWQEVKDELNKL